MKRRAFDDSKYVLADQSPTLDTKTPTRGTGMPQSQGIYQPAKKVLEKDSYHANPLKIVPLKKKRGRHRKEPVLIFEPSEDDDLSIRPCGYIIGNVSTYTSFSTHSRHSIVCQCDEFLGLLRKKKKTWHWYHWWKTAKTSGRYQFLFHHIGFNLTRSNTRKQRLLPSHVSNITIPGVVKTFTICSKQFFFLLDKHIQNYRTVIKRVWRDTVELQMHDTEWKPTRSRESKWFNFFRSEFPKWHNLVLGHYSRSDRVALVDMETMSAHITREEGFNKLDDYWMEFIRKSPHLNNPIQIATMEAHNELINWKRGKKDTPKPPAPSKNKQDQPFPTRDTFRVVLSKKCNLKRQAAQKIRCPVCLSLESWINAAKTTKEKEREEFLIHQQKQHTDRYDWHRRKIEQAKDTAKESWRGIFPINE